MATTAPMSANSGNNAFKVSDRKLPIGYVDTDNPFQDKEKPMAVRNANIMAARGMAFAQFTGAAAEIQQLLQMQ